MDRAAPATRPTFLITADATSPAQRKNRDENSLGIPGAPPEVDDAAGRGVGIA